MSNQERCRMAAIFDLITTERDYVGDLKVIVDVFKKPMLQERVVAPEVVNAIFSNVDEILSVAQEFLAKLDDMNDNDRLLDRVGELFLSMMRKFLSYTPYYTNHYSESRMEQNYQSGSNVFQIFLEDAESKPESRHISMALFLLKPLERICKYPLLIREIIKHTNETSPDMARLKEASERIESIKTIAKKALGTPRVVDIQESFRYKLTIVTSTRHLVRRDQIFCTYGDVKKPLRLMLFNDLLILGKEGWDKHRLVDQVALKDCAVADVHDKDGDNATIPTLFIELKVVVPASNPPEKKVYLLSMANSQVKQEWLDDYNTLTSISSPIPIKQLAEAGPTNITFVDDEDTMMGWYQWKRVESDKTPESEEQKLAGSENALQAERSTTGDADKALKSEQMKLVESDRALEAERARVIDLTTRLEAAERKVIQTESRVIDLNTKLTETVTAKLAVKKSRDEALERISAQEATLQAGSRRIVKAEASLEQERADHEATRQKLLEATAALEKEKLDHQATRNKLSATTTDDKVADPASTIMVPLPVPALNNSSATVLCPATIIPDNLRELVRDPTDAGKITDTAACPELQILATNSSSTLKQAGGGEEEFIPTANSVPTEAKSTTRIPSQPESVPGDNHIDSCTTISVDYPTFVLQKSHVVKVHSHSEWKNSTSPDLASFTSASTIAENLVNPSCDLPPAADLDHDRRQAESGLTDEQLS